MSEACLTYSGGRSDWCLPCPGTSMWIQTVRPLTPDIRGWARNSSYIVSASNISDVTNHGALRHVLRRLRASASITAIAIAFRDLTEAIVRSLAYYLAYINGSHKWNWWHWGGSFRNLSLLIHRRYDAINALDFRGNYSATSNNMKLVHWPLMSELLHLVQWGGNWVGLHCSPSNPLLAVPNVTAQCPHINGQCTNHCIGV